MKFIKNYQFSLVQKSQKIVLYLFLIILTLGLFEALILSPEDYLQGDSVRIMYVHVPSAWISLGIFSLMATLSIMVIIFKNKIFLLIAKSLAPSGFIFSLIALVTGSIWGKPTWGTWWAWDARITSMLILCIFYLMYLIAWRIFEGKEYVTKITSFIAILGFINIPIIKFSVDWWSTLHQPSSVNVFSEFELWGDNAESSDFFSLNNDQIQSRSHLGFGLVKFGNREAREWQDKITMRMGVYRKNYSYLSSKKLIENGMSLGFGIKFSSTGNQLDVSYKRGTRSSEDYFNEIFNEFTFGISIGDVWFLRRRAKQ